MDKNLSNSFGLIKSSFQIQHLKGSSKGYLLFVEPDLRLSESFLDSIKKFASLDDAKKFVHDEDHVLNGTIKGYNNLFVVFIPEDFRNKELLSLLDTLAGDE
jgi:dTDP-4-dehydrorhamnose 3,5-epimerase-like enzyme